MSQLRHLDVNDTLEGIMYSDSFIRSEEYERKMSNGLHSSFLALYCVMIGINTVVFAIYATIFGALVDHQWLWLLSIPFAALVVLLCLKGIAKAQKWGLRNLDEARAIANEEYERQRKERFSSSS